MRKGKWKEFGKLTEQCYENMIRSVKDYECWNKAFEVLQEIVADGRNERADFAPELYLLDDMTDYKYDVGGWLEDYLDELDMAEEKVLKIVI